MFIYLSKNKSMNSRANLIRSIIIQILYGKIDQHIKIVMRISKCRRRFSLSIHDHLLWTFSHAEDSVNFHGVSIWRSMKQLSWIVSIIVVEDTIWYPTKYAAFLTWLWSHEMNLIMKNNIHIIPNIN